MLDAATGRYNFPSPIHTVEHVGSAVFNNRPRRVVLGKPFFGTNNEAEYHGLLEGLRCANGMGVKSIQIFGDSMLVVKQVSAHWACKKPHLQLLRDEAWRLLIAMDWTITWIPRERNTAADKASNDALDHPVR